MFKMSTMLTLEGLSDIVEPLIEMLGHLRNYLLINNVLDSEVM